MKRASKPPSKTVIVFLVCSLATTMLPSGQAVGIDPEDNLALFFDVSEEFSPTEGFLPDSDPEGFRDERRSRSDDESSLLDDLIAPSLPAPKIQSANTASGDYYEDFSGGTPSGWSLTGLWRVSNLCKTPNTPPNYLGYHRSTVCDFSTGSRTTGSATFAVDLSSTPTADLEFEHFFHVECCSGTWDVMRVQIRSLGGTYQTLQQWSSQQGTNGDWAPQSYDISSWAGGVAEIRFFFDSVDGAANNFPGWYIDHVQVSGAASSPPSAPQSLSDSCGAPHGVRLNWLAPVNGPVSSYKIYGGMSSNPSTVVATVSGSQTTYTHEPSWTTSSWFYRVSAVNSAGESDKSNQVSRAPCDLEAPSSVSGLTSPSHSNSNLWYNQRSVSGSWNAATDSYSGVAGYWYDVRSPGQSNPSCSLSSVRTSSTSASQNAPSAVGEFEFRVRAIDNAGNCGPVTTRDVRVDTTVPIVTDKQPQGTTNNGQACVRGDYDRAQSDGALPDASEVRLFVNGQDVTSQSSVSQSRAEYCPQVSWSAESHSVELWVQTEAVGADRRIETWSFTYRPSSAGGAGGGGCLVQNDHWDVDGKCDDGAYMHPGLDSAAEFVTTHEVLSILFN